MRVATCVLMASLTIVLTPYAIADDTNDAADSTYQLFELRWTHTLDDRAIYIGDAWYAEYAYVGRHVAVDVVYFTQEYFGERYHEVDLGLGYPFRFDGDNGMIAPGAYYAASKNPDYRWIAPAVNCYYENQWVGVRMLALYYAGLDDESPDLYFIDPTRVGFKPVEWLTLGVSGKFVKYRGLEWETQIGPTLQFTTKIGRLEARYFTNEELQVAYTAVW